MIKILILLIVDASNFQRTVPFWLRSGVDGLLHHHSVALVVPAKTANFRDQLPPASV